MPTFTPRLKLKKPAGTENVNIADLNSNADALDLYAAGAFICTSTTRPTVPYDGMLIKETDTLKVFVWDASPAVWTYIGGGSTRYWQTELPGVSTSPLATNTWTLAMSVDMGSPPMGVYLLLTTVIINSTGITSGHTRMRNLTSGALLMESRTDFDGVGRTYTITKTYIHDGSPMVIGTEILCDAQPGSYQSQGMNLRAMLL